MRKKSLFCLLCMCLTTVVAFAGKESLYVLHEGFEEGIPATWTQDYISGQVSWAVEQSGASEYPASAFEGNGLVALRNTTGQTQHYTTRLITPVIDLTAVFQPILVFSHAQMQYAGDVDALYVYYRTAKDTKWVQVGKFENKTTGWKNDTIRLTAPTASYQLAFEGVDHMGRGIALDEVIVRPMPTCNDPSNVSVDGLTVNSAVLRWNGSLDTDSFHVVLSTARQTNMANLTDVVADQYVSNFEWNATDLMRNTTYYLYVQAHCGGSESEWASFSFTTKNLVDFPFVETFNKAYAPETYSPAAFWTHGTSLLNDAGDMELIPLINQGVPEDYKSLCSYSNSTFLSFVGNKTPKPINDLPIPAGHYAYAATPELNIESVSMLKATFWGTSYTYTCADFAAGIIVGVMTDPEDFSTFVAVDTVYVRESRMLDRFTVHFDTYTGTGKYIAFVSNFIDKENVFYIDDLTIDLLTVKDITAPVATNRQGARFDVNANLNGNKHVQLIVTRDTTNTKTGDIFLSPDSLPANYRLLDKVISASEFPYKVQLPEGGQFVQVYMRGVDGSNYGDYSQPLKVLVPMQFTERIDVNFEDKKGSPNVWDTKKYANYGRYLGDNSSIESFKSVPLPFTTITTPQNTTEGAPVFPTLNTSATSTSYGHKSYSSLRLLKQYASTTKDIVCASDQAIGDYIALPEVQDIKSVYLTFYMISYENVGNSNLAVGVMSDPFDPTTFEPVATCAANSGSWTRMVVTFHKYTGKGKFPALMAIDAPGAVGNYMSAQLVDDITLDWLPECMEPTNIQAVASDKELQITWDDNAMTEWVVNLYADASATTKLDSAVVTKPTHTFDVKQHTTYYYGVSTQCAGELTDAQIYEATTLCAPAETLPFVEDFESWKGGVMNTETEPLCWVIPKHGDMSGYYPYVDASNNSSRVHGGKAALVLSYGNSLTKPTQDLYAALPPMNDELQKLQIRFYAKPGDISFVGDIVYVGVMTDPDNLATFDTIAAVELLSDKYTDYIVTFTNYKGNGQHIALMVPEKNYNRTIFIDDIMVDYLADCEKTQGVSARNISSSGASIHWTKGVARQWEVLLATDTMTLGSSVEIDGTKVLSINTTTTMPYQLTGCDANATYYVYVRAVCDAVSKGEWSNPMSFETECQPFSVDEMALIKFNTSSVLDCWELGMRDGATTSNLPKTNGGCLVISNSKTTDGAYAIMPSLDIDSISRLQISFEAHGGTDAAALRELTVGVITNPSDLSTFTKITTLSLNKVTKNSALEEGANYTVRFGEYEGDYQGLFGKRIMFLSESGDKANEIYIWNLRLDSIHGCLEPLEIDLLDVTADALTIGWENLPSNKYQVQLLAENKTTVLVDTIITGATVKFEGLAMLGSYYAQVRQICAVGDTSIWSHAELLQTGCPATYPVPYVENFEGYTSSANNAMHQPECWEIMHNGAGTSINSTSCVLANAKKDGSKGYYLYSATSGDIYTYIVLPAFAANISELMMSFDYCSNNSSNDQYFVLGVATDVTSIEAIDASVTVVDTLKMPAATAKNWMSYQNGLYAFTGERGNIVLIAKGVNQKTFIDNIRVEKAPSCFRPENLAASNITKTSVDLTWTPMGPETAWDISCIKVGARDTAFFTVNTPAYTIRNLQHSSDYKINVRANCGDGDVSEWSLNPIEITTVYFVALNDAHWNFDNSATYAPSPYSSSYSIEKGWTVGNEVAGSLVTYTPYNIANTNYNLEKSPMQTIEKRYSKSGDRALRICGYASGSTFYHKPYASLPEIDADYNNLQVRFSGRGVHAIGAKLQKADSLYAKAPESFDYTYVLKIGTTEKAGDMSTFELLTEYRFKTVDDLKTIVPGNHWEEVIVPLYGAKGKYITFCSDEKVRNIVYLDDIVVEPVTGWPIPNLVSLDALTHNAATFSWKSGMPKWEVQITEQGLTDIIDQGVVETTTWSTSKLQPYTYYDFKVRAISGSGDYSDWRTFSFQTPCAPVENYDDFVYGFEGKDVYTVYEKTGSSPLTITVPDCWIEGKKTLGVAPKPEYSSGVIKNTTNEQYSRNTAGTNTDNAAWRFYNYSSTSSTYTNSYVILPDMDANIKYMMLHFWARAAYFNANTNSSSSKRDKLAASNKNYQKNIVIGTISDVNDINTFVPLDTFTYAAQLTSTATLVSSDPAGNDYWEEAFIPLEDYAGKGRIMILYPSNGKTSYFFIDDMEIIPAGMCIPATKLNATAITSTSATLNWKVVDNDSVRLQISTDKLFQNTLLVDTVLDDANGTYALEGLYPGTNYYYRLQHLCSPVDAADWAIAYFTTLYGVRFYEDFAQAQLKPEGWTRAYSVPEEVFSGYSLYYYEDNASGNWVRTTDCVFADAAMRAVTSNSRANVADSWLITPAIDMTYTDTKHPLMLSLQLGLSSNEGADIEPSKAKGDKFLVAVSVDGGKSWKRDNTIWWSDDKDDKATFAYSDIPHEGKTFVVDMSKYAGKQVKVAFVSVSDATDSDNYIYLANVSINGVKMEQYSATICEWEDYMDDNFIIDAYDLTPGTTTTYEAYVLAQNAAELDQYSILTLSVRNAMLTTFEATICEGENYTLDNFDIQNATASGVYKQKLEGVNTCDSVVVLNLTVLPRLRNEVVATICQGNYYEFNGVKYYTSTVKSDTLPSLVTGCDSIVSLYLTVNEILASEEEYHLCPGDSLEFGKFGQIQESGIYVDTLQTALMCDSVVTLYVSRHEAAYSSFNMAICQGESYSHDVWVGLTKTGDYPSQQKTVWGCDSIVNLHLMVVGANMTINDTVDIDDLPYVLNGEELLPVGTEIGVYTKTINLSCGEATVVIMVGQLTDINSVFTNSLALAPNLVGVGQETMVYGSFADDAVLEVYHTTGALVYRSANTNVVPGLPTAGVYMVTVKSNNQMYQSMLIVQ